VIEGVKTKVEEALFDGPCPSGFPPDLAKVARRKLRMRHAAERIDDLRCPPGNRLEALSEDRRGLHPIQINGQFRICFRWQNSNAYDVEIVDYHERRTPRMHRGANEATAPAAPRRSPS